MRTKMRNQLMTVSSPPHIYGSDTIVRLMRDVLIALAPAAVLGIYYYGGRAFFTILVSIVSALLAEFIIQKLTGKEVTIHDLSAVITGLLLAFNLPPEVPFWIPIFGSFFAIVVVKQLFGGLGSNFVNPALAARAFLLVSFPVIMNTWVIPDGVTGATYLTALKENPGFVPSMSDYFAVLFGKVGGCIGETSAVALIAGGIYLIVRNVINWRVPVFYIGSFMVFSFIFGRNGLFTGTNIIFEALSGGLMLGAFFMATDYATSPLHFTGKVIMGIGCGLLTALIRSYGGYPEGVCYSILIMNMAVPFIDKYIRPHVYGKGRVRLK